jgi:hypothetical protein
MLVFFKLKCIYWVKIVLTPHMLYERIYNGFMDGINSKLASLKMNLIFSINVDFKCAFLIIGFFSNKPA